MLMSMSSSVSSAFLLLTKPPEDTELGYGDSDVIIYTGTVETDMGTVETELCNTQGCIT